MKEMQEVYVVAACRTPIGKMGGALKSMTVADLSCHVFKEILVRGNITADMVDEIVMGETRPSSAIHNVARHAALMAGFPYEVTGFTIQQACASGITAIQNATNKIAVGMADIMIAGGVESMSNAPFFTNGIRYGAGTGDWTMYDSITESQIGAQPSSIFGRMGMGTTAETVAAEYGITREEQDAFAQQSQERYQAAYEAGKFDEIAPITFPATKKTPEYVVDKDEHPRPQTTAEALAKLRPVNEGGVTTAGNASGRNDGGAAMLVMTEEKAKALGYTPIARWVCGADAGVDPKLMGIGPAYSNMKTLDRLGMKPSDVGVYECNEAFAAQNLGVIRQMEIMSGETIDMTGWNPNGGAIAFGHPNGASGGRIALSAIRHMENTGAQFGMISSCCGGGIGVSALFERV